MGSTNWTYVARIALNVVAVLALAAIALSSDTGKLFAGALIVGWYFLVYLKQKAEEEVPNPVETYLDRLKLSCKLNKHPGVYQKRLILHSGTARILKGYILGGAVLKINQVLKREQKPLLDGAGNPVLNDKKEPIMEEIVTEMPKDHPLRIEWLFLYSPRAPSSLRNLPIIGGLFAQKPELLFRLFHNPRATYRQLGNPEELVEPVRDEKTDDILKHGDQLLTEEELRKRIPEFHGDVVIKGYSSIFEPNGVVERISDALYDADHANAQLSEEVDRINLVDNLTQSTRRYRVAIDGSPGHQRFLDAFDDQAGASR